MTRSPLDVLLPIGILLVSVGVLTLGVTATTAYARTTEPGSAAERACDNFSDADTAQSAEWTDCVARELAKPRWSHQGVGWSLVSGGLGGLAIFIALLERRPMAAGGV